MWKTAKDRGNSKRTTEALLRKQKNVTRRSNSIRITGNLMAYRSEFSSLPIVQLPVQSVHASSSIVHRFTKIVPTVVVMSAVVLICINAFSASIWLSTEDDQATVPPQRAEKLLPMFNGYENAKHVYKDDASVVVDAVSANKLIALSNTYGSRLEKQRVNFQSKIDYLSNETETLERTVSELLSETLELNRELLAKELEVVALKDMAGETVEEKVVYNFVNVPIGSNIDVTDDEFTKRSAPADKQSSLTLSDSRVEKSDVPKVSESDSLPDNLLEQPRDDLSDEYIDGLFIELTQQFSDKLS